MSQYQFIGPLKAGQKLPHPPAPGDHLSDELKDAIKHMVANISKSFIVEWYASISPSNHDFVASCNNLIEESLRKFAELCILKLDKYKIGQLIMNLLHKHIFDEKSEKKIESIESQIDNFEYDICQNSVVRLFGLLSNEALRKVVFTTITPNKKTFSSEFHSMRYHTAFSKLYGNSIPLDRGKQSLRESNDCINSDDEAINTTSALYTLVIAMLTKAAFMPIIENISEPRWLFAVIIWLCKKEERESALRNETSRQDMQQHHDKSSSITNQLRQYNHDTIEETSISRRTNPATSIVITNSIDNRAIDLEEGIDIASTSINFLNPIRDSLKRPLDNIEIYSTEEVKTSKSCYVLYCIRFDGLCYRHPSVGGYSFIPGQPDVPIIDHRQKTRLLSANNQRVLSGNNSLNNYQDVCKRRSFRRMMTIKRRFREFVLLQLRLEENPKIRPYMKNIPKPTKLKAATQNIFSLPGITNIKLDQSTIRLRQRFLERFLNALNSSPFIANSYEFKEFFSYNVHPIAGITKSKSTILQVNLNKVFVDSVRSAFSLIRSTLPGDDIQSLNLSSHSDPDVWMTELQQNSLKLHVQTHTSHSKMNLERLIDSKLLSLNDSPIRCDKSSSLGRYYQRTGAFDWMGVSAGGSLKVNIFKDDSLNSISTKSSSVFASKSNSKVSPSTSSISSQNILSNVSDSRSDSSESVYHDASSNIIGLEKVDDETPHSTICDICDTVPIASKLIDIVHYSINGDTKCSQSPLNYLTRMLLGRTIERFAIQLIGDAFTLKNAAFCIDSVTSSIWGECDDPPLDMENANLEETLVHLSRLIESKLSCPMLVPKQLVMKLINKQLRFYLGQIASQKRNKFVIYSLFVHLLDELEIPIEN